MTPSPADLHTNTPTENTDRWSREKPKAEQQKTTCCLPNLCPSRRKERDDANVVIIADGENKNPARE